MAIDNRLEVDGKSADFVFTTLVEGGLSKSDAAIVASGWIFENFGKTKRKFSYKKDFKEVDAACVADFARSFQHEDWVDGESLVQAEEGPGESGFNSRFHQIETDLDSVGADAAKAFVCINEMRSSLHALLAEIRTELNRLNSKIHDCCNDGPDLQTPDFPAFGGLKNSASFLGTTKFDKKTVSLWQTKEGVMVLPAVSTIGVQETTDVRVRRGGDLARFIADTPAVRIAFPGGLTKTQFVADFGNERTRDGQGVRELVEILPNNARFPSLNAMIDEVAEREATALRTTSGISDAIATTFGLETDTETIADVSIDRFDRAPFKVRGVLLNNNIASMADLSKAEPQKIVDLLKRENIEASLGEAFEWTTIAKTLINVR